MRFRKRPVIVEAMQFDGTNGGEIVAWARSTEIGSPIAHHVLLAHETSRPRLLIHTLEGNMLAEVGDYVIQGVHGEFYPCKPDIFAETYVETV